MTVYPHPIVFFDLDETLINKDATSLWIKWRIGQDRWAILEGLLAYLSLYRAYKAGKVTHKRLSRYYRVRTRRMSKETYRHKVNDFFGQRGQLHVYPQAASLLFAYRNRGARIVMITGADDVIAQAYANLLGIDDTISNELCEVNGEVIGISEPICYGKGKVELAKQFLSESGYEFKDCVFYSDSHADLPMLESVAQPVVLNPNQKLDSIARQRNWPILDWRKT